jgi:hypothetical protein
MTSPAPVRPAATAVARERDRIDLFHRVRAEYLQMPGLHLTAAQARRLFGLDTAGLEVLDALVRARFLRLSRSGGYVRAESY